MRGYFVTNVLGDGRDVIVRDSRKYLWAWGVIAWFPAAAGCGGDARVELSAAESLDRVAREVESALQEYHAEVEGSDDRREARLASDFAARVRRDVKNAEVVDQHAADFMRALSKIRDDRRVEWERHDATMDHVAVMREVGNGLREIALQNLRLDEQTRRYFDEVLQRLAEHSQPDSGSSVTIPATKENSDS